MTTRRLTLADVPVAHVTLSDADGNVLGEMVPYDRPVLTPNSYENGLANFRRSSEVNAVKPASDKQIAFLHKLVAERMPTVNPAHTASVIRAGNLRVREAIKVLLTKSKVPSVPSVSVRVNQFARTCEDCGTRVEAEAGVLTMTDEGKWEVAHKVGECPLSEFPFPVGRYAVEVDGVLHFFVANHEGFFEQASDVLYPVTGKARRDEVVALIAADPESASREYGREIGRCGRCSRTLTNEASRARGMGIVCEQKARGN